MESCCTKKGNCVRINTHDQDQKHKSESLSLKTRAESSYEYSDDENSPEYLGDLQYLTPKEIKAFEDGVPLYPESLYRKPSIVRRLDKILDSDSSDSEWCYQVARAPRKAAPIYPSAGSCFSMRPLTPEKPQIVTTISIMNPTEKRVTS